MTEPVTCPVTAGWAPHPTRTRAGRFGQFLSLLLFILSLAACAVDVTHKGLRPLTPSYPDSYRWHFGNPYDTLVVDVDSQQPTLAWESFPRLRYLSAAEGKSLNHIRNVTYELKISRADAGIVYERKGLTIPQHRVEKPLQTSTRYHWSVRAHFDLDGHPRVTGWGEMEVDVQSGGYVPRNIPYTFRTPPSR